MAPPKYACATCGGTQFEEQNGIWYCFEGHAQEGGQQIAQDDDDYARSGKISRKKEIKETQKRSRIYRGSKGFQFFLKAWQFILWKQCYELIHRHGLPPTLWTIVRELWSLRLSKLSNRLGEPTITESQDGLEVSTSESGTEQDEPKNFKTDKHITNNPSLYDTISLNYIGILVLRQPTRLSEIYSHIREERICYIRAIRHVPGEIRDHLAPEYQAALDTTVIPTQHNLQLAVYRSATMYGNEFSMVLPPLNWPSVLLDYIQNLALPLEVYPVVKKLAGMLNCSFSYPQRHEVRRHSTTYPEVQLMSLIVIATKMLYPFDSDIVKRYPDSVNEPTAFQVDWKVWMLVKERKEAEDKKDVITPSKAIEVIDADILQMPVDQLDQYMNWFQRTYVKEVKVDHQHKEILSMFPVQTIKPEPIDDTASGRKKEDILERLGSVQAGYQMRAAIEEDEINPTAAVVIRPGQQYQQYRSVYEMSEITKGFHQEAADLACISVEALLKACLRTERTLLTLQHEKRRAELFDS